jgi:hypothetical protein
LALFGRPRPSCQTALPTAGLASARGEPPAGDPPPVLDALSSVSPRLSGALPAELTAPLSRPPPAPGTPGGHLAGFGRFCHVLGHFAADPGDGVAGRHRSVKTICVIFYDASAGAIAVGGPCQRGVPPCQTTPRSHLKAICHKQLCPGKCCRAHPRPGQAPKPIRPSRGSGPGPPIGRPWQTVADFPGPSGVSPRPLHPHGRRTTIVWAKGYQRSPPLASPLVATAQAPHSPRGRSPNTP